ncbi:MAG: archaeosortase/exosortase family protein [Myxococcales bacterium]|nr:archaeosortase/exosortase family protein [Myxococcales bacterium]
MGRREVLEARGGRIVSRAGESLRKRKENQIQQLMRILPWVALGCAFSPVLIQLANAIPKVPFGWSILLAPILIFAATSRCERSAQPRRGWAPVLLIAGLLIELVGLAGGSPGIARLGLPISVVGLSLWTGVPRLMTALLVLWAIPIPGTLYGLTTPNLESAYARFGAAMMAALGAELSASGPLIRSGAERLELAPYHSGIHLIFLITELSWYAAVRKGLPPMVALARTTGTALLAIPLQLFAVWVAVLLLTAGLPEVANIWLDHGVWLLTAILGLVWIETR